MNPNSHREQYETLIQRCKRLGNYSPDSEFKSIGDVWAEMYKRRDIRQPAAELIVGYLSEFIDRHFAQESSGPSDVFVSLPRAIINSAIATLQADGDEHGVARFLSAALKNTAPQGTNTQGQPTSAHEALDPAAAVPSAGKDSSK